jgi:hypothetical protein
MLYTRHQSHFDTILELLVMAKHKKNTFIDETRLQWVLQNTIHRFNGMREVELDKSEEWKGGINLVSVFQMLNAAIAILH